MVVRPIKTLLASFRNLRGARPREVQERADLHRLFLYTRLHELEKQGGGNGAPAAAKELADAVVAEAAALAASSNGEGVREAVAAALRRQALAMARGVHEALEVDGKDPAPAAAALREWGKSRRRGGGRGGRGRARPMPRPGSEGDGNDSDSNDDDEAAAISSSLSSSSSSSTATTKQVVSGRELASLAARRVGFGLRVGPSRVGHSEAGMGLFIVAAAAASANGGGSNSSNAPRAVVPAGALLALFPGLCYARDDYRRMPGYPKVDRGNPYLAARYDAVVVDSQPWAHGDGAVDVGVAGEAATAAQKQADSGDSAAAASSLGFDPFRPRRRALPGTFLARMARASDGPRLPPSAQAALKEAADARLARAVWCSATTDEATALEMLAGGLPLEGRNPYALAHFANHPKPGQPPNAMLAPIDLLPDSAVVVAAEEGNDKAPASPSSSSLPSSHFPPELRAYLPFAPYEAAAALTSWPVERALKRGGEEAAVAAARRLAAGPPRASGRGAAELALRGARGLGLVALRPLAEGEEVVFDYRLSPGMLGRPSWYVPCDEGAEDRRWA